MVLSECVYKRPASELIRAVNKFKEHFGGQIVCLERVQPSLDHVPHRVIPRALMPIEDDVVARIEARIAAWTFLPTENGEAMQVLHYELGQKYEPHFDYFRDKVNQQLGGHRVATVLMYLSDVEKGGETIFPNSEQLNDDSYSDCAKNGYAFHLPVMSR